MSERLEQLVAHMLVLCTTDETGAKRLPPERELGFALEISRGALREQLSQLENLGVLHRRQGHGSYLDVPDATFIRTYFTLMRQLDYLSNDQFAQAREMLEVTIAASAAAAATDKDVIDLRSLVERMIYLTSSGDAAGALEADLEFHDRLYTIIDNPIFNILNQGLSHVLRRDMQVRRDLANSIEAPNADGSTNTDAVHYGIVDALAAHNSDAARAAMSKHFTDFSILTLSALRMSALETSDSHGRAAEGR